MPFQKGRPKTGGRKAGGGLAATVAETLARLKCNPIEGLARIAEDKDAGKQLRLRAYAELAQYVYPKRRAIEMSGPEGAAIELNVSARDTLLSRIAGLAARTPKVGSA